MWVFSNCIQNNCDDNDSARGGWFFVWSSRALERSNVNNIKYLRVIQRSRTSGLETCLHLFSKNVGARVKWENTRKIRWVSFIGISDDFEWEVQGFCEGWEALLWLINCYLFVFGLICVVLDKREFVIDNAAYRFLVKRMFGKIYNLKYWIIYVLLIPHCLS